MNRWIKTTWWAIAGLAGAIVLALLVTGGVAMVRDVPAELLRVDQAPEAPAIGDDVTTTAVVRLPWHRRVTGLPRFQHGAGLQPGRADEPTILKVGPGYVDWQIVTVLQPIDFGPFDPMEIRVPLSPRRAGDDTFVTYETQAITPITRFTIEEPQDLAQVGELSQIIVPEEPPPRWPWALTAVAAVVALWLLLRKKAGQTTIVPSAPVRPPWELAGDALVQLEGELPMEPDRFFVRLVDILRRYLEAAFHLRATEQTTAEFFQTMQASPDLLSMDHRSLLEEVLRAADIVKFARTEASEEQMREALTRGRRFIVESAEALRRPSTPTAKPGAKS